MMAARAPGTRAAMDVLLIIVPIAVAVIAVLLGRGSRRWLTARLVLFAAVVAVAAVAYAASLIDPSVPDAGIVEGLLLAAAVGAFAVAAFYTAGYAVRGWPLAAVLVVMAIPDGVFLLV